jgi:hypothetical protein
MELPQRVYNDMNGKDEVVDGQVDRIFVIRIFLLTRPAKIDVQKMDIGIRAHILNTRCATLLMNIVENLGEMLFGYFTYCPAGPCDQVRRALVQKILVLLLVLFSMFTSLTISSCIHRPLTH